LAHLDSGWVMFEGQGRRSKFTVTRGKT